MKPATPRPSRPVLSLALLLSATAACSSGGTPPVPDSGHDAGADRSDAAASDVLIGDTGTLRDDGAVTDDTGSPPDTDAGVDPDDGAIIGPPPADSGVVEATPIVPDRSLLIRHPA